MQTARKPHDAMVCILMVKSNINDHKIVLSTEGKHWFQAVKTLTMLVNSIKC